MGWALLPLVALFCFSSLLSASVIGHLDVANCGSGGVTVTATTIDWLPAGGGTGCVLTGTNTNVTYSGGTLSPGATGVILDLPVGPLPTANFMTFAAAPGLTFSLDTLGPAPGNTNCASLLVFQSCAVSATSPFALTLNPGGSTSVTLIATGTASDGTSPTSTWSGGFTTQISNKTPGQIQSAILANGSVTSTHSGDFVITLNSTVPEPASMILIGRVWLVSASFAVAAPKRYSDLPQAPA